MAHVGGQQRQHIIKVMAGLCHFHQRVDGKSMAQIVDAWALVVSNMLYPALCKHSAKLTIDTPRAAKSPVRGDKKISVGVIYFE